MPSAQERVRKMRRTLGITVRDGLATLFVAIGVLVYVLFLAGIGSRAATDVRVVTAIYLVLGFAASASAVVPGFEGLWHGSKLYLVGTSLLGLAALAAGVVALVTGEEVALGFLVAITVVLWAISTVRHAAGTEGRHPRPTGPRTVPGL